MNTVPAGQSANVTLRVLGNTLHLTFDIPRGADGSNGSDGGQGPAGEVGAAALLAAIAGSSANSNAVSTIGMTVNPDFDASQFQTFVDRFDALVLALRR